MYCSRCCEISGPGFVSATTSPSLSLKPHQRPRPPSMPKPRSLHRCPSPAQLPPSHPSRGHSSDHILLGAQHCIPRISDMQDCNPENPKFRYSLTLCYGSHLSLPRSSLCKSHKNGRILLTAYYHPRRNSKRQYSENENQQLIPRRFRNYADSLILQFSPHSAVPRSHSFMITAISPSPHTTTPPANSRPAT